MPAVLASECRRTLECMFMFSLGTAAKITVGGGTGGAALTSTPLGVCGCPQHSREQPQHRRCRGVLDNATQQPRHSLLCRSLQPVTPAKTSVQDRTQRLHPRGRAAAARNGAVGLNHHAMGKAGIGACFVAGAVADDEGMGVWRAPAGFFPVRFACGDSHAEMAHVGMAHAGMAEEALTLINTMSDDCRLEQIASVLLEEDAVGS